MAKQPILLKLAQSGGAAGQQIAAAPGTGFRKLFDVPASPGPGRGAAPAVPQAWYRAELDPGGMDLAARDPLPWDIAHQMVRVGMPGMAAAVLAAEPDFLQAAYPGPPEGARLGLAAAPPDEPAEQKGKPYVPGTGFAWHLDDAHSGLRAARDSLKVTESPITIVHLDTGWDPDHKARPANVPSQANFVEGGSDARDRTPEHGLLTNRGHGTGTIGILAGQALAGMRPEEATGVLGGAAPMRIVPVRIADSVVHFWTSAVAEGINHARAIGADVVSMSMGGLPSAAWADAVNAAYEAGIVVVCAAGNNFGGAPTELIVYPARFDRVIAACGAMADGRPYFDLPATAMAGNAGPPGKMRTAMAAYTPNIPWARLGVPDLIDRDGGGTSAATPQIAAAAALWLHRNGGRMPRDWRRAEAARQALFRSAATSPGDAAQLGQGLLRARAALDLKPADLVQVPPDTAHFAFLHLLTSVFGLGPQTAPADMLALETTQLALFSKAAQAALPDPDRPAADITPAERERFFEALLADGHASATLRAALGQALGRAGAPKRGTPPRAGGDAVPPVPPGPAPLSRPSQGRRLLPKPPPARRLRIFATDPGDSQRLRTAFVNTATVSIPWEQTQAEPNLLKPGPVGEYVEVVDIDPASGVAYEPVDLNDTFLLAQDGLSPAEGNPQFHQQMTYAVAMRTIRHFEVALGRRVLWADRKYRPGLEEDQRFVRRLRIYPHALRQANAYYSPDRVALLFGYFPAAGSRRIVFTCLSHDIVAHETTHALLDGLHRRYQEATNPDVLAFHEGFADLVAIFQHFTFPELLRFAIAEAGGDLRRGDLLAELAREFGHALGRDKSLRSAIGTKPDPADYATATEPHDRGAVLVAAVFDAFLAIHARRTADLLRIATGGSGILGAGAISPDIVNRLAEEAAKAAGHTLTILIRALDYMPPVDPTFAEFLRALITADSDLVADDRYGYRVAFLEAFASRGIQPSSIRTLSVESLRWQTLDDRLQPEGLGDFLRAEISLSWDLRGDRRESHEAARGNAKLLHAWLLQHLTVETACALGLEFRRTPPPGIDPYDGRRDKAGRPEIRGPFGAPGPPRHARRRCAHRCHRGAHPEPQPARRRQHPRRLHPGAGPPRGHAADPLRRGEARAAAVRGGGHGGEPCRHRRARPARPVFRGCRP
ncbi:S8 family serine peptidase [Siccirubricoccus sp. G192]|uniref:S8 family serine peptidase n=1 Tax=Siccirubricoccus sp. G192 TaxID=2849651 RepID=UPI001C2BBCAC|nr:S8 family serine peptidase [Siccirubricoccus sp. G192]MBV1796112.1 S8 family serine peptidase [Siccirubricoccus sp. G192]